MRQFRFLVAIIGLFAAGIVPVEAQDAAALKQFQAQITPLVTASRNETGGAGNAMVAFLRRFRGFVKDLRKVETKGLPDDLRASYAEFVIASAEVEVLMRDWPDTNEAAVDKYVAGQLKKSRKAFEEFQAELTTLLAETQKRSNALAEVGKKYGITDLSQLGK